MAVMLIPTRIKACCDIIVVTLCPAFTALEHLYCVCISCWGGGGHAVDQHAGPLPPFGANKQVPVNVNQQTRGDKVFSEGEVKARVKVRREEMMTRGSPAK